ncbi:hypothetical protein [Acinetobacter bouvetii]|uniref:Uncharacterized protein n=1 Tax=Acinetobacter bouvetii TaxID=202951 RepID=A0A811GI16_9GAMM|nr:hypothetical protein [Acinetobacter bouvetii]CAB1223218.1 hypothetical protein SFB21_3242 [Acinetobacter bouvetii]
MSRRSNQKVLDALTLIAEAQQELRRDMEEGFSKQNQKISSQSKQISALQEQCRELRDTAIMAEARSGESNKDIAERYNLSPGRVSQIKGKYS